MKIKLLLHFGWISFFQTAVSAQSPVIRQLDEKSGHYAKIARQIWEFAEVGYQEVNSSALLQSELQKEGFEIKAGVADIPTAFTATFGSGKPIIGILAEFDALPGVSQDATPTLKPLAGKKAGHACGHHLFGTASMAAAIATKNWLKQSGQSGTIRLYGTPAEEGGSGKVYMVRAGLFDDVDVVLHWHPSDANSADAASSLANKSAKFRFYGIASHASGSPEKGRSALDGIEAMNMMVNMMREHVPSDTRIHYVITKGGEAPNVVPEYAESYYYCRHPDRNQLAEIWKRLEKCAEGAALGTGTRMEYEIIGGTFNVLPNEILAALMHKHLEKVGGVKYEADEKAFAEKIQTTLIGTKPDLANAGIIRSYKTEGRSGGSTDVGDVSWAVPTVGLRTATWVPGTSAHSWQAVAAGGMSIGYKGMMVAAKTLSLTAIELFESPNIIKQARVEWLQKRGNDFKYEALLGNRKPALDYRK